MIGKIKHIAKKDIVSISFMNGMATLVRMLTGLVSVKVVAVLIGPSGIALVGQLNNFSSLALMASTGGVQSGVTKYVAQYKESARLVYFFTRTATRITLICSSIVGLLMIFLSDFLSDSILHSQEYSLIFVIFGFTILLYSFNSLIMAIINGYKEFKKFVIINICSSVIGLIFSVGMVYVWGVKGALISSISYQSIVCIVTVMLVFQSPWFKKEMFFGPFRPFALKKLSGFALMTFVSALCVPLVQIIIRSYIVQTLSLSDAGMWEGMNRISAMYLTIITSSLSIYYLPRLSELKTNNELRDEILSAYKIFIPILLLGVTILYVFRHLIVHLLFSTEFEPMNRLFSYQLIGDFFKITSWVLAYLMIAKSMIKLYVFTEIIFGLLTAIITCFLVSKIGLQGSVVAYMVVYILYFLLIVFYFRKLLFSFQSSAFKNT